MAIGREHRWDLDGYLAGHGGLPMAEMSLSQFVAYVWWFFTRDADEMSRAKFRNTLWRPPKPDSPIPEESPWSARSEAAAFAAFKSQVGPSRS